MLEKGAVVLEDVRFQLRALRGRDVVVSGDLTLPAPRLRAAGRHFQRDEDFVASAQAEARRVVDRLNVTVDSAILDIGCGAGRLAIGLLSVLGDCRHYLGVDVDKAKTRWCRRYIQRQHPGCRFVHVDVANARYNPGGRSRHEALREALDDRQFDVMYLYSVFSHMVAGDVDAYLGEMTRALKPTGRVFLTAFVEENVPDVEINPEAYLREWSGELHCVRFARAYFERLLDAHGLMLDEFEHGTETDGQSALYIRRASGS